MPVQCAPTHSNVLRAPLNAYDRQILGPHPPLENLIQVVCTFNTSPGNSDWDPKNIFWEIQWHSGRQQNLLQASLRWLQSHERTEKGETELVWEIEERLPGRGAFKEEVLSNKRWKLDSGRHRGTVICCHALPKVRARLWPLPCRPGPLEQPGRTGDPGIRDTLLLERPSGWCFFLGFLPPHRAPAPDPPAGRAPCPRSFTSLTSGEGWRCLPCRLAVRMQWVNVCAIPLVHN